MWLRMQAPWPRRISYRWIMSTAPDARDEQTKRWNSAPGHAWVEMQAVLDQTFTPLEILLVDAVAAASPARVLDIGCGTGATTLAVARRVAPKDGCVGVDI